MHLIQIAQIVLSDATEVIVNPRLTVPVVGITVVMLGLISLAFVLKMFVFLDNETPKVKKDKESLPADTVADSVTEEEEVVITTEDDELTAIAFAIYLYTSQEGLSMPLTHDDDYRSDNWHIAQRQSQLRTYNRWSALRRSR